MDARRFVWPSMNRDVSRFVRSCIGCQRPTIHPHTSAARNEFELPKSRFRHVHIDLVGRVPTSNGKWYLLTMIDRFSGWSEAVPLPDMRAESLAQSLKQFVNVGFLGLMFQKQSRQIKDDNLNPNCSRNWHGFLGLSVFILQRIIPKLTALNTSLTCVDLKRWCDKLPLVLLGLRTAIR